MVAAPFAARRGHPALEFGSAEQEQRPPIARVIGHIRLIAERGRMGWPRASGHGCSNSTEAAAGRYERLIGPKLRASEHCRLTG